MAGPFTRVTTSAVTGISWTNSYNSTQLVYMVRGLLQKTGGCGSYTNMSQGAFRTAHY
jgi:hypothetical protein